MIWREEAEPLIVRPFCPDNVILMGFSGSIARCLYQATGALRSACDPSTVSDRGGGFSQPEDRPDARDHSSPMLLFQADEVIR